nr:MAG TPA: hypothetical protein [Caudoviricetes sp.]
MQYVLLTVTDEDSVIKGFDCIVTEDNQYEMRESRLIGFGEIATTVYGQDEYEDFINVVTALSEGVQDGLVKQLNILRRNGVNQWI